MVASAACSRSALVERDRRNIVDRTQISLDLGDSRFHGVELLEHSCSLAIQTLVQRLDAIAVEFNF